MSLVKLQWLVTANLSYKSLCNNWLIEFEAERKLYHLYNKPRVQNDLRSHIFINSYPDAPTAKKVAQVLEDVFHEEK